jgi:putative flippase GtrA
MTSLALRYVFFAFVATGVNLLTQRAVFVLFDDWLVLYAALFVGTLAGLVTKYVLDKRYIFNYQATSKKDDLHKFGLYSLMGVFTTIIFWGTEMTFYYAFEFNGAQYIGGALGLMVGYIVKYLLDRKYVFKVAV